MTAPGAPNAPTTHRSRRPATSGADSQVVGALLLLGGVIWLLQRSGAVNMSWATIVSILLVVLGVGLVVTARSRGGGGLIFIGIVMTLVLASTSSIDVGVLKDGVGDRAFHPATLAEARQDDALGIGSMQVDLRDLDVPDGTNRLKYTMGIGEMNITVPEDVPVRVRATMRGGEIQVFDRSNDGSSPSVRYEDPDYAAAQQKLDIVVTMAFGNLQVQRVPSLVRPTRAPF